MVTYREWCTYIWGILADLFAEDSVVQSRGWVTEEDIKAKLDDPLGSLSEIYMAIYIACAGLGHAHILQRRDYIIKITNEWSYQRGLDLETVPEKLSTIRDTSLPFYIYFMSSWLEKNGTTLAKIINSP